MSKTWGKEPTTGDTTDGVEQPDVEQQGVQPPDLSNLSKEEFGQKARDKGWNEQTAFDYASYENRGGKDGDWLGKARVYEWSGDYGDVAPEVPELEEILFASNFITKEGAHRKNLELEVVIEGPEKIQPIRSFAEAGLHPVLLENLKKCGYEVPTPVQSYSIPAANLGYDTVAIAQTGSGKTAAYLIPIISKLMGKAKKLAAPRPDVTSSDYNSRLHRVRAEPLVVVVVPTRELAIQIFDEARRLCYRSMLRPCVAYGGLPMGILMEELEKGCDILIASPGRLCDIMDKPNKLTMSRVKYTVIDEADEMLNQDWEEELHKIMAGGDTNEDADHQYMMFSATFPPEARKMAREYMAQDYIRVRVGRAGQAHKNIRQNVIYVDQNAKREAVYDLLMAQEQPGRTLIFCNSRPAVDHLDDFLYNRKLPTTSIHGERNQREREDAIRNFRTGRAPILIATGVSARGWDVKDVHHVINYDLPNTMYGGITEYVHRIGRTARIGNQGLATSFYNDGNEDIAQDLVNILAECECEIPDFLNHLAPEEGQQPAFADDSDEEEGKDGGADGGGDAWGGNAGEDGDAPADTGFTADHGPDAASSW